MGARQILRNAVAAAIMAPSSHNTQPWRFRIIDDALHFLADPSRQLLSIDPEARQLVQSCGCALYNARVAVRAMGYDDRVVSNLHSQDLPTHVATLHLGGPHLVTDADRTQMTAIGHRVTNRRTFLARPVAETIIDELAAAAAHEGATLVRLHPREKAELAQLVDEADREQFADASYRRELAQWLVPPGSMRRDGIPFVEKEYGSGRMFSFSRTLGSPHLGEWFGMLEDACIRSAPAIVVLGTPGDDCGSWLAAGQALEAVLLHATTHGLAAAFDNQVLEIPRLRRRVAALAPTIGAPQMILRIGFPSEPVERAARRRAIDDVLDN